MMGDGTGQGQDNPDRFRRINRANHAFQARLGRLEGGEELLVAAGFREEPGALR